MATERDKHYMKLVGAAMRAEVQKRSRAEHLREVSLQNYLEFLAGARELIENLGSQVTESLAPSGIEEFWPRAKKLGLAGR